MTDLPAADQPAGTTDSDRMLFAWLAAAHRHGWYENATQPDGTDLELFDVFAAGYVLGREAAR